MLSGSILSSSFIVLTHLFFKMAKFSLYYPLLNYGIHHILTGKWKYYPFHPFSTLNKIPIIITDNVYFIRRENPLKLL